MSKRYKLHPNDTWHASATTFSHGVTVEVRDVQETYSDGHTVTWGSGAHRVKAPGQRTRVFIGETSWSDALRLADDYVWAARRQEVSA